MKSKYIFFAVSLFTALSVNAQETYENAKLAGEDLNGTARYVGMGGAMELWVLIFLLLVLTQLVSVCSVIAMSVSVVDYLCSLMVRTSLTAKRLI